MSKNISYLGIKIATLYKNTYVISWQDKWIPSKASKKLKSQPWTPSPKTSKMPAVTVYNDKMSGGQYYIDPDSIDPQPKSLGRWNDSGEDSNRFYSKRTKDVDKSAAKQRPTFYQVPWNEAEGIECQSNEIDEPYYGLELMEASYSYQDADGNSRYMPQWKPTYTKEELEYKKHTQYKKLDSDYYYEDEPEEGEYGYVEEGY